MALVRLYAPALLVAALAFLPGLASDGGGGKGPAARAASGGGPAAAIRRGREVYVAEGCIHCHSQYVRPGTRDVALWGPYREVEPEEVGAGPVLIGNRRQGPDLLNVGNRRGPVWQRLHLEDPRALVPGSRMPSYAHLFAGGGSRGEDLVAYLASLGRETAGERYDQGRRLAVAASGGSAPRGAELFAAYCAPCHGPEGRGDGPLAPAVTAGTPRLAAVMDLAKESFWMVPWGAGADSPEVELARVVKLGIGNTPMPGHEYLTDRQVADLVAFLQRLQARGAQVAAASPAGGEVRR